MDWNKASGISGVGTFFLTAIMLVVMVLQLVHQSAENAKTPTASISPVEENKPMNPWVMPSILASALLVSGCLHLRAASLQRTAAPQNSSQLDNSGGFGPLAVPVIKQEPKPEINKRIVVDVGPDHFRKIFAENMEVQAAKLIEPFIGTWMKLSGTVQNITNGNPSMLVAFEDKDKNKLCVPMLHFDQSIWQSHLSVMQRGTHIDVIGRIAEVNGLWIGLEDCELL